MRSLSSHSILLWTLLLHNGNYVLGARAPSPKPSAQCTPAALGSFDYIIVGGGTAGLVLANRLTEHTDIKVAVIEAGTSPEDVAGNLTQVPGYAGTLYAEATELKLDWGFQVTPQEVSKGLTLKVLEMSQITDTLTVSLEQNGLVFARKSGKLLPLGDPLGFGRENANDGLLLL